MDTTGSKHNLPVAPLYDDVMRLWGQTSVAYTPTLVVSFGGPSGEYYWYEHTNVWEKEKLLKYVPRSIVDSRSRRPERVPEEEYYHITVAEQTKKLIDQGNMVQVGAHGQLQGLGAHWELWMLEQGGMTPLEALRSATLHGARYLGLDREIGSLAPGKLADLAIIDGNPLADLKVTEKVTMVMVNGRLFDTETLNELREGVSDRDPLYWEEHHTEIGLPGEMSGEGVFCSCGRQ